jgi:hypothetical protein
LECAHVRALRVSALADSLVADGRREGDQIVRRPGRSATVLGEAMDREWAVLAASRGYRRRLRVWADQEPALDFFTGDQLIKAVRGHESAALEALARLAAAGEQLALRTALQILLPRLMYLAGQPSLDFAGQADMDERLAILVDLAGQQLLSCEPGSASTPYDFRLWSNIRRAFSRGHARALQCAIAEVALDDVAGHEDQDAVLAAIGLSTPAPAGDDLDLQGLAEWVAATARVSMDTATLVAVTRVGGIKMSALAEAEGVAANGLVVRRRRAERKLAMALTN